MSNPPGDEELVRRLRSHDDAALEALYLKHNTAMLRVATAILGSRASAEEVAQETWLLVLRNIDGFEGRGSLAGWIYTILCNTARTRARRDGRSVALEGDGPDGLDGLFNADGSWAEILGPWEGITPEKIVHDRRLLEIVLAAIDRLPPVQRAVLILRGQQGLDTDEVCKALEITPGNMRILLHRSRTMLRRQIADLTL